MQYRVLDLQGRGRNCGGTRPWAGTTVTGLQSVSQCRTDALRLGSNGRVRIQYAVLHRLHYSHCSHCSAYGTDRGCLTQAVNKPSVVPPTRMGGRHMPHFMLCGLHYTLCSTFDNSSTVDIIIIIIIIKKKDQCLHEHIIMAAREWITGY